MLALGLLLFGVSLLSLQDSLIKLFAPHTSFWQLQLIRSSFNMLFAIILVHGNELLSLGRSGGWALELQGFFLFTAVAVIFLGPGRYKLKN